MGIYLPENISGGKKRIQSSNPDVPGLPLLMVSYISFMMENISEGERWGGIRRKHHRMYVCNIKAQVQLYSSILTICT